MTSIENEICYGTSYVKTQDNMNASLNRPRRYKRASETSRRHTFYGSNRVHSNSLPSGHESIQNASFNKSASKQCLLKKLKRQKAMSLPNMLQSYNPNLNEMDGLNSMHFKKSSSTIIPQSSLLLPFDSSVMMMTVTSFNPNLFPSSIPPTKQEPQSNRGNTLPKSGNSQYHSEKNYSQSSNYTPETEEMKGLTKDKAATTTSGKPKKKRASIFSFFSRKKRTEPKPTSTLDDNVSHGGGSELNFDEVIPQQTAAVEPVKSKKTFRAPLPPAEENKENEKEPAQKRLSNASGPPRFSRQGSRHLNRRSSSSRRKSAAKQNSQVIKGEESKSVNSNDSAPNDPPPPIPPPLETCIDDSSTVGPPKTMMTQYNSSRLTVLKTETIYTLKKDAEITPLQLEIDNEKSLIKEKKKQQPQQQQQSPISKISQKQNDEITTDMIFSSPLPPSHKSSPKQTKSPKKAREDFETPPAIPQSAPPDPKAIATALSFAPPKHPQQQPSASSSVKRLSNFGLSPAKVPPIPVSPFEDLTDSSSESGNSTNITMPIYTNGNLKQQLHQEHKKLLSMFEEWEMLRRPQYSAPNDGHTFANLMTKQESVLRQHAIVTSLYNQLLAPVISNHHSSPVSTLRLKPAPPRHIINPTNSNPPTISRGYVPSLYKSRSTFDVMNGDNNNTKKETERNYEQASNYSPRISQTKRYSAGDALNPHRPRLGSTEMSSEDSNPRYDERKKYVVEQKPVVRNVPIITAFSKPPIGNIIITEPKRNIPQTQNNYSSSYHSSTTHSPPATYNPPAPYSPPMTKRQLTPVNEKPVKQVEAKKENINIEIRKPPPHSNNVVPKSPSPLVETKIITKLPPPPNYSPRMTHYYANSPPMTKRQVISNGFYPSHTSHSPPVRQISLPEVIQKQPSTKPPTPILTKKAVVASKPPPKKPQSSSINNNQGDLLTSISSFPNVTLRSVPKPVEKSFNLGRVLEEGDRPSSHYHEPDTESSSKTFNASMSGPPAPPPPPPPPASFKKASPKQNSSSSNVDSDAIRGDMLAEIRKAGGIRFLRSVGTN